jgi:hypothetical protein
LEYRLILIFFLKKKTRKKQQPRRREKRQPAMSNTLPIHVDPSGSGLTVAMM